MAIVICHLRFVVPEFNTPPILQAEAYIAFCGLALFFLLSGYSLMIREKKFDSLRELKQFYKGRLIRIFPLYWLALLVAYFIQPSWYPGYSDYTITQMIITIAGLQSLFTPYLFPNPVLWFVSVILVLYYLFPAAIILARRFNGSYTKKIALSGTLIFVGFLFLSHFISVDDRFFAYYWFFIVGIILAREVDFANIRKTTLLLITALAVMSLFALYVIQRGGFLITGAIVQPLSPQMTTIIVQFFVGIIGVSIAIAFTKMVGHIISGSLLRMIERTSRYTFSIYLFHLYFLFIASSIAGLFASDLLPLIVILLGVPLAIIVPPFIENYFDRGVSSLINKKNQISRRKPENGRID